MRTHLAAQRAWLSVERLPAYAPDLNPVEYLWANLKGTELANFTGDTIAEVADQAHHGIQRVCDSDSLIVGFLAHTSLSLDDDPSPSSERINRDQFRMRLGGCLRCPPDGAIWGVWKCRMAVARL